MQVQIGEIAKRSGVSKDAVRLYTHQGLVHCSFKMAGSKRYAIYDEGAIELIQGIKVMQSLGFTLVEIKPLAELYHSGTLTTTVGRKVLQTKLLQIEAKQRHLAQLADQIRHKIATVHPGLKD